ncbi:MAG: VRR-NUC domain-containing protein [Massilia sp.]
MHSAALRDVAPAIEADEANLADPGRNPLYYLDNFQRVLDWITTRYAALLGEDEAQFITQFAALPCAARALLVRMIMRKGTLFRASKLNYEEVGCSLAAAALLPAQWLETDPVVPIDTVFALCSRPEISAAFALDAGLKAMRKAEQLESLRGRCAAPRRFSEWMGNAADPLYQVMVQDQCDRLRLIFFGNFRQDWTELILSDLGMVRYEQVAIAPASQGFRSRADIDGYIALHQAKEDFRAGADPLEVLARVPATPFENDWLDSRRQRLLFQLGQHLEKSRCWDEAHAVYAACRFPGARARAVRVLEKTRQFGAAHQLLCEAMRAPESEAERQHLLRIAPRLTRQLGLPTSRAPKSPPPGRIDLLLPRPGPVWWVEGVVRDHLALPEAPVVYVENALFNALFGLLCWEAIFSALPGAFFHPYQRGPADLFSADFVPRRAAAFAACLAELDSDAYLATIRANFAAKHGIASPFVGWEFLDEALLELALACIAPRHLRLVFERMLVDLQDNRSGFPDLIQFWPGARRYRLIEVKGPGDRLQDNQVRWLDYCARHQLPVAVCYLQWRDT